MVWKTSPQFLKNNTGWSNRPFRSRASAADALDTGEEIGNANHPMLQGRNFLGVTWLIGFVSHIKRQGSRYVRKCGAYVIEI